MLATENKLSRIDWQNSQEADRSRKQRRLVFHRILLFLLTETERHVNLSTIPMSHETVRTGCRSQDADHMTPIQPLTVYAS